MISKSFYNIFFVSDSIRAFLILVDEITFFDIKSAIIGLLDFFCYVVSELEIRIFTNYRILDNYYRINLQKEVLDSHGFKIDD